MKPYPEYKDSGVEWIGKIPNGWNIVRMKNIMYPNDGRSDTGSEELLSVTIEGGGS